MNVRANASLILCAAAIMSVAGVVVLTGSDESLPRVAVIGGLAIFFFATRIVPELVTSLLCFLAFLLLELAPPDVIFSGFAVGGIWLTISGLIIGTSITQTGLGQQIATRIFARTGASYIRTVLLLATSGLLLGFLVPSTIPRIIVMMPVAVSLASAMGMETGSRGQVGLAITAATSTLLPTYAILTANLPTIVHYGALETLLGIRSSYADYFVAQLPANLVRFTLILACLLPFARNTGPVELEDTFEKVEPMTTTQKQLLGLLFLAIAFWATDSLHGISPAWIAMAVAAIVLVPNLNMMKSDAMKTSADMTPVFFLAGVFGVSAVAQHVGLDSQVASNLVPRLGLAAGSGLHDIYAIAGFSTLISHLTTAPAAPVVLAPLASAMAEAAQLPVLTVAMAQIIGIATPILPYQAPPLIVAMALAHISVPTLTRVCMVLTIGVAVIGIPLTWVWWRFIGIM
ncbi:MAG: hypothetical protein GKR97_14100 [Rhizobiaceae bacterium]|nr:hypothetical protein [Rhizobiaceae bacterium]